MAKVVWEAEDVNIDVEAELKASNNAASSNKQRTSHKKNSRMQHRKHLVSQPCPKKIAVLLPLTLHAPKRRNTTSYYTPRDLAVIEMLSNMAQWLDALLSMKTQAEWSDGDDTRDGDSLEVMSLGDRLSYAIINKNK